MSNKENNKNSLFDEFSKGLFRENPAFVLLLGLCPSLAISTTVVNGIGMGLAVTFVLVFSNLLIALLKDFIPEKIKIPAYIVIIATFVTIIDLSFNTFLPSLSKSLGIYVPLIAVNCIILGRLEAFASKNNVTKSILDAFGMGLGFIIALTVISFIRELLGTCMIDLSDYIKNENWSRISLPIVNKETSQVIVNIFNKDIEIYSGALLFISPAGALFVFGMLLALINAFHDFKEKIKKSRIK